MTRTTAKTPVGPAQVWSPP